MDISVWVNAESVQIKIQDHHPFLLPISTMVVTGKIFWRGPPPL